MSARFTELAIDCADAKALASFWAKVLGYEVQDEDDDAVAIAGPPGSGPVLSSSRSPNRSR
jgi:hypothetical protein